MATTFGYVRVSSQDQNEDRQLIALREKLVDPKQTYIDGDHTSISFRSAFSSTLHPCSSTTAMSSILTPPSPSR